MRSRLLAALTVGMALVMSVGAWGQEVAPVAELAIEPAPTMSESFEEGPPVGWELVGGAQVQPVAQGHALVCAEPGMAFWLAAEVKDFTLKFRLRAAEAPAVVIMCGSGEPPNRQEYELTMAPGEMVLIRRKGEQAQELGRGPCPLRSGVWHNVAVQVGGGQLQVSADGQNALTARDAQPPGAGSLGFGSHGGQGVAFDDISVSGAAGGEAPVAVLEPIGPAEFVPPTGQVGETRTPGEFVHLPASPEVLQLVAKPPSRAMMLQPLLADPGMRAIIEALPEMRGRQANDLMTMCSDGTPAGLPVLTTSPVVAGAGGRLIPHGGAVQPAGAATSVSGLDWKNGIKFTLASRGPSYWMGGQEYLVGALAVDYGMYLPTALTLKGLCDQDVAYMYYDWVVFLFLELPPAKATYAFACQLVDTKGQDISSWAQGKNRKIRLSVHDGLASTSISKVYPLSDKSGITGMCSLQPHAFAFSPYNAISAKGCGCSCFSASVMLAGLELNKDVVFGGITVRKL